MAVALFCSGHGAMPCCADCTVDVAGGAFIYRDVFNGSWQLNGQSTYQEGVKALCTATTTYICAKAILLHPTFRVL